VITAARAHELGFVNRVYPRDRLAAETEAWAARIAATSAFSLRMFKMAVNQAQDAMGFHAAVRGAHSHYQLSQISNSQWRRRQGSPGEPRSLVERQVREWGVRGAEPTGGAHDR